MSNEIKPGKVCVETETDDMMNKVIKKFDKLSAFDKIGKTSFFDWLAPSGIFPKVAPGKEQIEIYTGLLAREYDFVRLSNYRRFGKPNEKYFYVYSSLSYTQTLTQLYSRKKGTTFLMKFIMNKSYMKTFSDYGIISGGSGYFVPSIYMDEFNSNIIGGISFVKVFIGGRT